MAMRLRWWATAVACLMGVVVLEAVTVATALAHPLGNFTVNHYSRIELSGDVIRVRYVLDLAEIPSIQETRAADTDADGTVSAAEWDAYKQRKSDDILQQLDLVVDNQKLPLKTTDVVVSQPLGQGDIPLVRLEAWYQSTGSVAPNVAHQASFRDRSDPARIGWREIVVHAGPGATLGDSSVPAQDVSDELRSYPDDMLQSPVDRREVHWSFIVDGSSSAENALASSTAANRPTDPFAALVTAADLNPTVVLLALLGAAFLGGIHAASPGHGKSIMAAYIVGTQGTFMHAIALALSVTLSHTTGVLILGVLTLIASNLIFPERLYPWLTLTSGVVVLVIGARFLLLTLMGRSTDDHNHHHDHEGEHDHAHGHPHPLSHAPRKALAPTWRNLFALGLAGGIVPSGSALVVLLSSIALGRLGFGLVLIVAFGVGMAVVLGTTGVLLVHAGRFLVRFFPEGGASVRLRSAVPVISASVMTLLGCVATFQGITQIGTATP